MLCVNKFYKVANKSCQSTPAGPNTTMTFNHKCYNQINNRTDYIHPYTICVVTKLDTPKSDYRERTGTEWLVLGLGWG